MVSDPLRAVLHVGCGPANPHALPQQHFAPGAWQEIRLDIDPGVAPDILASITDMRAVSAASVDAVFSSHNLEHLHPGEVPLALSEFRRVLRPGGFALVTMPDLQQAAALVAAGRLTDVAYMSPAGPITARDILYGYAPMTATNPHMQHRTGFTDRALMAEMRAAGFQMARVWRDGRFGLWGLGVAPAAGGVDRA